MMAVHNLFAGIPPEMPEEVFQEILRTETFRIERIVSRGQASPPGFWYDQETDEWVLLVSGSATLRFDDGRVIVRSSTALPPRGGRGSSSPRCGSPT